VLELRQEASGSGEHSGSLSSQQQRKPDRRQCVLQRYCRLWLQRGMARAWVRWTEYVDQRARSKEVCSKVLRRMQNMKVAGVFDAWSAVCERKRQKACVEPRRAAAAVRRVAAGV